MFDELVCTLLITLNGIKSSTNKQYICYSNILYLCSNTVCFRSHLTEKLLSKLHSAALSSSPLIRRQSLLLVLRTLPPNVSLKFLLAYLDDDVSFLLLSWFCNFFLRWFAVFVFLFLVSNCRS